MNIPTVITREIKDALANGAPVVALESTIISHGMPYPKNLEVAMEVEEIVRKHGAIPATIAIIEGVIHIGLDPQQLEKFAQEKNVFKSSRRDLGYVISKKMHGGTTVASTMILADMAGIKIFATGGIGGVHRGAELTWDVSADLIEFTKSNVAVVSAGAKAILDLPKTLEYLETLGVPVIGYNTHKFPAFYTRDSGIELSMSAENPREIAGILLTRSQLGQQGGMLIANPIPSEFEIEKAFIDNEIEKAIKAAAEQGISGKALTPFLLSSLNKSTDGKSQTANKALVLNNAKVAAQLAVEWSLISRKHETHLPK